MPRQGWQRARIHQAPCGSRGCCHARAFLHRSPPNPALLEEGSSRLPSAVVPLFLHQRGGTEEPDPWRGTRCGASGASTPTALLPGRRAQSSALPRLRGQLREHSLPRGCSSSKASPSKLPGLKLARGYRLLLGTACGTRTRTRFCTGTLSSPEQRGTARPLPEIWGWQQSPRLPPLLLHQHLVRVKLLSHPLRR